MNSANDNGIGSASSGNAPENNIDRNPHQQPPTSVAIVNGNVTPPATASLSSSSGPINRKGTTAT